MFKITFCFERLNPLLQVEHLHHEVRLVDGAEVGLRLEGVLVCEELQ